MKKIIVAILCMAAASIAGVTSAYAQTKISGTVKDGNGEVVPGALITLDGNSRVGAMTDAKGQYSLTIPAGTSNPSIVVNCLGYQNAEEQVGGRSVIDIVLKEDNEQLDEVVVVGYGSMRKSDLTGSVTSVRIDEADADRSSSLDKLLQGRAAGVQVLNNGGSPDGGVSIRVRGLSSFSGSSEPLYVVDGIIINASSSTGSLIDKGQDNTGSDEAVNGLMGLNPSDIASLEILKDASATAIYGAQGANGVVLITTKSANSDKPRIRFNAGWDLSSPYKKMDILNFDEYVQYLKQKSEMGVGTGADTYLTRIYEDTGNLTGLKVNPVDWQDECMRTALSQRYYLSVSGRQKELSYAFSLGYTDNQGIIKTTGVKQYTVRLNIDKSIAKKLKIGTKTSIAFIDSDLTQGTAGGRLTAATSMVRSMVSFRPYTTWDLDSIDDDDDDLRAMPLLWINRNHFINKRREYRITPSIFADWKILKWLSFRSTFGGDYRYSERSKYKSGFINSTTEGTNGAVATLEYLNWNWDNVFNMTKKIKNHSITGMVGSSAHSRFSSSQTIQGWNIKQYRAQMDALNTAPNTAIAYSESEAATLSFFARAIYNYDDRYVLTTTLRADGSSKFRGANKWAFFPSFAFAWRLSEEKWFNVPLVSSAKLRLGWGRVGNQTVSNYQTMSTYNSGRVSAHDNAAQATVALLPDNLSNPGLKWETSEQLNGGLDISFWKGRLAFTADVYYKRTYDLLQAKSIPTSSGYSSVYVNEGSIENKGLEFTLDAVPLKFRNFEWGINGNISFNRNKILRINDSAAKKGIWMSPTEQKEVVYFEGQDIGSANYCVQTANIFMEGYPMGVFYGYKIMRIIPVGETGRPLAADDAPGQPGQFEYYDLNGNGYIDEDDRCVLGDPNPDFTYGFGTTLTWKRLTLSANFNGCYGNDIFNVNLALETDTNTSTRNIKRDAWKKAWTPANTDTRYPALGLIRSNDYKKFSDFYLEDGTYLRLASVALSYEIPIKKGAKVLKGANVGVSVNNAYVWTKYSGWDPEVNSYGTNIRKMGVDQGSYPNNRSFSFDVKLTF